MAPSPSEDLNIVFYFPREGDREIPTGCGYYIGMVIASMLAQDYSIDELLRLDDEALINKIELSVNRITKSIVR